MLPYASAKLPLEHGEFQIYVFKDKSEKEHVALVYGDDLTAAVPQVRLHSECFTGDVLHSKKCDCGSQLEFALKSIAHNKSGMVIYLRQEGRGIGLGEKIKAYQLQEQGQDTVEANISLGKQADERDYKIAGEIIRYFDLKKFQVLTNNPAKIEQLIEMGFHDIERIPCLGKVNDINIDYLKTKSTKMKHLLDFN